MDTAVGEKLALIFCEDMVITKSAFELLDLLDALDEESGESLAAPIRLRLKTNKRVNH